MGELGFEPRESDFRDCESIFVKYMLHLLNYSLKNSHNNVRQKHFVYTCIKAMALCFRPGSGFPEASWG